MARQAIDAGLETGFEGLRLYPAKLGPEAQRSLIDALREAARLAPPYRPRMPKTGQPWSIMQTNLGPLGWVSDPTGYRYDGFHPLTHEPWPAIPSALLTLWAEISGYDAPPECCLVNIYRGEKARMGLHQDRDEEASDAPVVSISLGDTCLFRVGGFARSDKTKSFRLASGDVLVLGGASRMRFHGVDRVHPGTSQLVEGGGRLNLTLRRVTKPLGQ
ncbi:MAG: alpha-ketoglutarate-dependent dioxygenase AlkB [Parvibaculum sp.]|uniref:alpha-ketoglutarate-dependent dioxygenase AlkB n=1 Tax=Parvibaculum sp. TaxID=2024848 RepID=UPI0025E7F756|nr:alpha-ketoglutarate-dependent dioxygenase AlkB [Parvibaculum sp.]MCE9648116.1 alpha-ketoglutarate-dependent dioxygenase AlkB [Parvibaculum sp.]